jgi:hypothetical protein
MENLENEMVSISKSDLLILLETSLMLRNYMQYLEIEECYNIIEDGSLCSDTFDETGEYSDEEYEIMDDRVESYLTLLEKVTKPTLNLLFNN